MDYNFDEIIPRRGTDSLKYDFAERRGKPADILPLWVADMDFRSPPEVLEALEARCRHGIFGYSDAAGGGYFETLSGWLEDRFGWKTEAGWLVKTPGVVCALALALRALTAEGEAVLIQPPVYYPFSETVRVNGRKLVENRLVYRDGRYEIDLADFERKIIENHVKLFILCSPHNPVGRVWTRDELLAMGEICLRHGVFIVSDDIHADFVRPGHRHLFLASLSPELADVTVTCTAPSKTFNLAGLQISNIFISNSELRRRFRREMDKSGYSQPNVMGLIASRAAYERGGPWLEALKAYLEGNFEYLKARLEAQLPQIRLVEPQGTYLAWLDCRALGLTDEELDRRVVEKAGLWLDGGTMFGPGGEGFERVNVACPRAILEKALDKLIGAFSDRG